MFQLSGHSKCPWRSWQAPACAAGHLSRFLETLLGLGKASLLLQPSMAHDRMTEDDRAIVIENFARGRGHVVGFFSIKFGHCRQLPWLLLGLAHWVPEVAQERMARAVALLTHASSGHWLAVILLSPGTLGRTQVDRFVLDGYSLDALPFLKRMAGRMMLAPVTERWVEGLHSVARRWLGLARSASAVGFLLHADPATGHAEGVA